MREKKQNGAPSQNTTPHIYTNDSDFNEKDFGAIAIITSICKKKNYSITSFETAKELYMLGRNFDLEALDVIKAILLTMKTRERPCEPFSRVEREELKRLSDTEFFQELNSILDEIDGIKTFFAL